MMQVSGWELGVGILDFRWVVPGEGLPAVALREGGT